jgi:hypothetical protein
VFWRTRTDWSWLIVLEGRPGRAASVGGDGLGGVGERLREGRFGRDGRARRDRRQGRGCVVDRRDRHQHGEVLVFRDLPPSSAGRRSAPRYAGVFMAWLRWRRLYYPHS